MKCVDEDSRNCTELRILSVTSSNMRYGLAVQDRAWKFSKRVELVRAGTDKWEASFEERTGRLEVESRMGVGTILSSISLEGFF